MIPARVDRSVYLMESPGSSLAYVHGRGARTRMRDTTANNNWLAFGASFVHLDTCGHLAQKETPRASTSRPLCLILTSLVKFRAVRIWY